MFPRSLSTVPVSAISRYLFLQCLGTYFCNLWVHVSAISRYLFPQSLGTCFRNDPGEELEACALMAGHQSAAFALLPTVAVRRGTRLLQLAVMALKTKQVSSAVHPDPYPDCIWIQWGPWIRIRIQEGKNDPQT